MLRVKCVNDSMLQIGATKLEFHTRYAIESTKLLN